jgi:hypothetical protein
MRFNVLPRGGVPPRRAAAFKPGKNRSDLLIVVPIGQGPVFLAAERTSKKYSNWNK